MLLTSATKWNSRGCQGHYAISRQTRKIVYPVVRFHTLLVFLIKVLQTFYLKLSGQMFLKHSRKHSDGDIESDYIQASKLKLCSFVKIIKMNKMCKNHHETLLVTELFFQWKTPIRFSVEGTSHFFVVDFHFMWKIAGIQVNNFLCVPQKKVIQIWNNLRVKTYFGELY